MADNYFNSNTIKVFPSGFRGQDFGESKLTTEQNLLTLKLLSSKEYNHNLFFTDPYNNSYYILVIKGYAFTFLKTDLTPCITTGTANYAVIKLRDNGNNGKVLDNIKATGNVLDQTVESASKFQGLKITADISELPPNCYFIQITNNSGTIVESKLALDATEIRSNVNGQSNTSIVDNFNVTNLNVTNLLTSTNFNSTNITSTNLNSTDLTSTNLTVKDIIINQDGSLKLNNLNLISDPLTENKPLGIDYSNNKIITLNVGLGHPTTSGSTNEFIDDIYQDNTGKITATKKALQIATTLAIGGVKSKNTETMIPDRYYSVQVNSDGTMKVNVPWTDTNTTYNVATSSTAGLVKIGYKQNAKNYPVLLSNDKMYVNVPWTDTDTTYSAASKTNLGLIKLFSDDKATTSPVITTTPNRTYAIQLNNDDQAVVNVPWTDTTYIFATGNSQGQIKINSDNYSIKDLSTSSSPSFAAVTASGTIQAQTFVATSDERLKENIKDWQPSKSILDLKVKEFDYKENGRHSIGCIAQDLQEICPEIVHEDAKGYLTIEESKLVYLLLDEIKKLKDEIEELKNK